MEIKTLGQDDFSNLFPQSTTPSPAAPAFGATIEEDTDLFTTTTLTKEPTTQETPPAEGNTDILGDEAAKAAEEEEKRKPRKNILSEYFEERIKSGKFIPIEQDGTDGKPVQFIPHTPEEFDEVIALQINYQLEEKQKELETKLYQSKTPAWQAVLKYAALTDDPSDVIPFIQGVKNIQSISSVDENDLGGAETIVRARMSQTGETQDVIEEQIEALKTTGKLISTAQKLKPVIVNQEKQQLTQLKRQKEQESADMQQMVESIRTKAIEAIEQPFYGAKKLRDEEKAVIYDLIGEPETESKGYGIYTAIDQLFEKGDFDTLKQVALLVGKKESYLKYIQTGTAQSTAAQLQTKLRLSTDNRSSSGNDQNMEEARKTVKRTQYNTPRFGRS